MVGSQIEEVAIRIAPGWDRLLNRTSGLERARVHFQRRGSGGPRLLFLHPIGFNLHTWDAVIEAIEADAETLAMDLPGHGESDKPADADYGVQALASRVCALLDQLRWESATWVGNSLGGGVSLAAAALFPERVKSLILLNPAAYPDGLHWVGRLERLGPARLCCAMAPPGAVRRGLRLARGPGAAVSNECHRACIRYLRSKDGRRSFFRTLRALYGSSLRNIARRYPSLSQPCLIAHGEMDPLIALRESERLCTEIRTASLVRLPGCGHFPQEERPAEVARLIREHLLAQGNS